MKINNTVIINEIWGYDVLFPILQDAFRVLYLSYSTLYSEKKVSPYVRPNTKNWQLENEITNDLIKKTINIPTSYRFQKQQADFETNTLIDIAILYNTCFGDNSNDIKIECKRLDNIDYILNDGIMSYKNNKYSEKLRLAGMLFYNTQNVILENINHLNDRIEKKISKNEILQEFEIIENYQYTYKSTHQRFKNSNLDLYSCAFDFCELIESHKKKS